MNEINFDFLNGKAREVAPLLLGCMLQRRIGDNILSVKIVETEAYDQSDLASHSYNGITDRNRVMFGSAGHLYVYFTYGMHYCCNIVVGETGEGSAVLIRAVEPILGHKEMAKRRKGHLGIELTNGPAKLCQALDIDRRLDGHYLKHENLLLIPKKLNQDEKIIQTTRIGIIKSQNLKWRFYIQNNPYVSKK